MLSDRWLIKKYNMLQLILISNVGKAINSCQRALPAAERKYSIVQFLFDAFYFSYVVYLDN